MPAEVPVGSLMRRRFIALAPSDSLHDAEALMRMARLRTVPVVLEGGVLAGVLSYGPLVRWCLGDPPGAPSSLERRLRETRVDLLMRRRPACCDPTSRLEDAAAHLVASGDGCLPIVEWADGTGWIVGIVTEADLLRAAFAPPPAASQG